MSNDLLHLSIDYCNSFLSVCALNKVKMLNRFPEWIGCTYLYERSKKTLKISGELAQCTSLPLGIAVSGNINKYSHTGFQPAKIPLL